MQNSDFINNLELYMRETDDAVNKLRRQIKSSYNKTLVFSSSESNITFSVKALNSCQGYVEIYATSNEDLSVEIKVNGLNLYTGSVSNTVNKYCGFYQGVNEITVNSNGNGRYVLKVYGNLSYLGEKTSLNHVLLNDTNYVFYFDGKNLNAFAELDCKLTLRLKTPNIIQGCVVNAENGLAYIVYLDNLNYAYLGVYDANVNDFSVVKALEYKANSVFGYYDSGKYNIFASRLNSVFKSKFALNESVTFSKVNLTGKIGYLDYQTKSAFIIVDNVSTARLVLISGNEFIAKVIPFGTNYHVIEVDGGYTVTYFDGICYRKFNYVDGKIQNDAPIYYVSDMLKYGDKTILNSLGELQVIKEQL